MPHIVTDNCDGCRFTDCVSNCPVACFHGNDERLFIDPDVCIDCGACIPACPVKAIYDVVVMPKEFTRWIAINAEMVTQLPVISGKQVPKPAAEAQKLRLGF